MKITSFRCLFVLMSGLLFSNTEANAQGTVFLNISCAKYVEETAVEPTSHAYNWFVAGYMSAINLAKNRASSADAAKYRVWLTTYCQQRPFENFINALIALDGYLGEGKNKGVSIPRKAL